MKIPRARKVMHPATRESLKPYDFRPGNKYGKGAKRVGESIRGWWNALTYEADDGTAAFTLKDIKGFANAREDSKQVSPAKRIAAKHILEMMAGGRTGREVSSLVFDRTEGKAPQSISIEGGPEVKQIILRDERIIPPALLPEPDDG